MSNRPNRPRNKLLYLNQHKPHFGPYQFVSKGNINTGDVISFKYTGIEPGDEEEMRWVFVLDPEYEGKLHGLTLGMTPMDALVRDVINPMYDTAVPYDLYYSSVFAVAKQWDSYRTYFVDRIKRPRRTPYYLTEKPVFKGGKRIR